ncbi:putative bifunctional diguanylate cyclase/phosphodiesterase [Hydrogenophaga aquatica]
MTALAYTASGWVSLQAAVPPDYISVIFIAAGVAVGAVLTRGNHVLPGVLLGALAVQWLAHRQAGLTPGGWVFLMAPLGATLQAWATAAWARRQVHMPSALDHPMQVVVFLFLCLPVGSAVNASLSVPALVFDGSMPWREAPGAWLTWWLGDTLGAVLFTPLVLVCCGQPAEAWRPRIKTVALPMVVAMALIGAMFHQLNQSHQRALQEQFDKAGQDLALRLERRLQAQTDSVVSIGKLMELAPRMAQPDFESATQPWLRRYAGTQNFGWSPYIPHAQRLAYEQGQDGSGMPGIEIKGRDSAGRTSRARDAEGYLPLTWVEPLETNRSVLGLDVSVLPATSATVLATMQSRRPEVTEGIRLVQESGEQRGVVMYLAVYEQRDAQDVTNVGTRTLKGVVSAVFRMDDVIHAVLGKLDEDSISLCLIDPAAPPGNRRLAGKQGCETATAPTAQEQRWAKLWPLKMGDREWVLRLQAGPAFWGAAGQNNALATSVTGLVAVALLGAFLLVITGQGRRTARLVEERTQELARSNASLVQLAHFDPLTGMANRTFWMEQAEATLAAAHQNGKNVAVVFLDLDRFKHVNDSLGHSQGDHLLRTVAARMQACLRSRDVLARIGGDEFVVLLPWVKGRDGAAVVAKKITRALSIPVEMEPHEITVTASLGVALYPDDGHTAEALLRHADTAMYSVKASGRNNWRFFSPEMHEHVSQRLIVEAGLRRALAPGANELYLEYQPQVDARTGQVLNVEALLRWNHPELGEITPTRFIPVAEETGMIDALGQWVVSEACRQIEAWERSPDAPWLSQITVSVNVSAMEFNKPNFLLHLREALATMSAPAHRLELEITESLLVQAGPDLIERLQAITDMGISLALDDFGTGYSSLGYLKRLPLSKLKIDRSFVMDVPGDAEDEAIIRATLSMAHDLGLHVVAEGVETPAQRDFLQRHGCDVFQGWLYSKALPADALAAWLRARPPASPAQA